MLWIILLLHLLSMTFGHIDIRDHYLCPVVNKDSHCKSCGKDCILHNSDQNTFIEINRHKIAILSDPNCDKGWIICSLSNSNHHQAYRRLLNAYNEDQKDYPMLNGYRSNWNHYLNPVMHIGQQLLRHHIQQSIGPYPNQNAFGGGQHQPMHPMADQYPTHFSHAQMHGMQMAVNHNVHNEQYDEILFALGFEAGYDEATKDITGHVQYGVHNFIAGHVQQPNYQHNYQNTNGYQQQHSQPRPKVKGGIIPPSYRKAAYHDVEEKIHADSRDWMSDSA